MDNLSNYRSLYQKIHKLMEEYIVTDDDQLVFDAFEKNDIRHACQAIRATQSGEVEFQHLTLRFGSQNEQSVYQFDLSDEMSYCLDLYSLYLALRQTQFQLETFHPDLISNVVVPIRLDALLWEHGQVFIDHVMRFSAHAFSHLVPSLQIPMSMARTGFIDKLIEDFKERAYAVWFEISSKDKDYTLITYYKPHALKLSGTLENKEDRAALLPLIRFFKRYHFPWVASRVGTQAELNQYRLLGASYYFGYFSDIPTSMSFKAFSDEDNEVW
ncbi:DUF5024 domain-containing protein [Vibrio sp. AK197]|uniref:Diguanylate phosphodiesterase n=1 Tax=Vibrio olivae TaxID=1243002 RepID=A0ABV5HMA3_9VIBR